MTAAGRATRGYTLVALCVAITVLLILVAATLPLASTEAQRDKEEELIFRGRQYAESIRLFHKRYGRYPNTLKELIEVKPRSIRKLWKDPMTNSDRWGLIHAGDLTGGGQPVTPPGGGGATGGVFIPPTPTPRPVPTKPAGAGTGGFGGPASGETAPAPIVGVYSTSPKKGFRLYEGRDVYSEWKFSEQGALTGFGTSTPNNLPGPGGGFPGPTPAGPTPGGK